MKKRKELLCYYGLAVWVVLFITLLIFQNWEKEMLVWTVFKSSLEGIIWAAGACTIVVVAEIFLKAVKKKKRERLNKIIITLFGFMAVMLIIDYYVAFRTFFSADYIVKYFLSILVCLSIGGITPLMIKNTES